MSIFLFSHATFLAVNIFLLSFVAAWLDFANYPEVQGVCFELFFFYFCLLFMLLVGWFGIYLLLTKWNCSQLVATCLLLVGYGLRGSAGQAILWACVGEVMRREHFMPLLLLHAICMVVRLHICCCHIVAVATPNGQLTILPAMTGIVLFGRYNFGWDDVSAEQCVQVDVFVYLITI